MQNFSCIKEVEEMCKEAWLPSDIAEGEYWLEITWEHQGEENKFMIIYGKENIEVVNRMLGYHPNHQMDHNSKQQTA